jgi:glycosyltransferase involved in cell wall biosynthesis
MCDYYEKIDVYICVSITEGTPKPLLEAMGCGVPVITTDVGVVKEYIGEKQKEFVLGERDIKKSDSYMKEKLKNKIIQLYDNRKLLLELSKENYEKSKCFNSKAYKKKYIDYFSSF